MTSIKKFFSVGDTDTTYVLLIALVAALVLFAIIKLSNPNKKYSTQKFWETATIDDVYEIPEEPMLPGNSNGSVLMWAATTTSDPAILAALVARGADVNEEDIIFSGTPLSFAAGFSKHPDVIDELVRLGADIHKVVGSNNKTPLIIAAELNANPEIIERLIANGADTQYKDLTGRTALEQARRFNRKTAITVLEKVAP